MGLKDRHPPVSHSSTFATMKGKNSDERLGNLAAALENKGPWDKFIIDPMIEGWNWLFQKKPERPEFTHEDEEEAYKDAVINWRISYIARVIIAISGLGFTGWKISQTEHQPAPAPAEAPAKSGKPESLPSIPEEIKSQQSGGWQERTSSNAKNPLITESATIAVKRKLAGIKNFTTQRANRLAFYDAMIGWADANPEAVANLCNNWLDTHLGLDDKSFRDSLNVEAASMGIPVTRQGARVGL
jgi:hypothetical protein